MLRPLIFSIAFILLSNASPVPNIRNLHARFHAESSSIYVEWQFPQPTDNIQFTVRYKTNNEEHWKYVKARETRIRLSLQDFRNMDELSVQVQAERAGQVIEDWSQVLVITINKKITIGDMVIDDDGLLPPLDFTAHVLGPSSVKLEWKPHQKVNNELYYLVNVKQLTSDSGAALHRQQIKTHATSFSLGKLIPGERYEMTIRSALSSSKISSTAAIVEISMPLEENYFEIGNLIISSNFNGDGRGTVTLNWDVPPDMVNRITAYNVQYADAATEHWQRIPFHGTQPTATLSHLKSNTEYLLKIKTSLANNLQVESGQFKFKTPKVETNPIQKVDVIYSHEVNSVKLQWMLEPHVKVDQVAGYDVYVSENKDAPEAQWKLTRLDNKEASLSLDDLKSSTTYYVRVNLRNSDGSVIRAPSIYRFKTMDWSRSVRNQHVNPFQF